MTQKIFENSALFVRQGPGVPPPVLLSASAVEINQWVGIPQKTRVVDGETLGFQRDDNPDRIEQIAKFYGEPRNVIHNPLLCAIRQDIGIDVDFKPDSGELTDQTVAIPGTLTIKAKDRSLQPLRDLFREAREALEQRVPELVGHESPDKRISELRALSETEIPFDEQDDEDADAEDSEGSDDSPAEEALFEESHVSEFWAELKAREVLLDRLGDQFTDNEFVGFGRDAVESYLRPVVLVDGQHRLLGALQAARSSLDSDPSILTRASELIAKGATADSVENKLLIERSRRLPISMLLDAKPGSTFSSSS